MYSLTGYGAMGTIAKCLNGKTLMMGKNDKLSPLEGVSISGTIKLEPGSSLFIVP